MEVLRRVPVLLWLILPAYVANGAPVVGVKILGILGLRRHPIDCGRNFVDGRRVFGDNKTWEGLAIGVITGALVGLIQTAIESSWYTGVARGLALGIGAMLGDLLGAFIKRRLGLRPGEPLPVLDQVLFLLVALALAYSLNLVDITVGELLVLIVITIALHLLTNYAAYMMKLKDVPW